MDNLIKFLMQSARFLMFIVLEAVAFIFIIRKDDFKSSVFDRHATSIAAQVNSVSSNVTRYFGLQGENDALAKENADLRDKLNQLQNQLKIQVSDSSLYQPTAQKIHFISAKVAKKTITHLQNVIVIDKGTDNGISENMGVLCSQGVVGVVDRVSAHFSVVLPVINIEQRLSVKLKKDNQLGTLVWNGQNVRFAELQEIPMHVNPFVGDTVVTSGYSAIFPEGVMVGVVSKVTKSSASEYYKIKVELSTDFGALQYVTVDAYYYKNEQDSLENRITNEE